MPVGFAVPGRAGAHTARADTHRNLHGDGPASHVLLMSARSAAASSPARRSGSLLLGRYYQASRGGSSTPRIEEHETKAPELHHPRAPNPPVMRSEDQSPCSI
jgi:hypothetical protein